MWSEPRRGDTRTLVEVGCAACVKLECRPYGTALQMPLAGKPPVVPGAEEIPVR